MKRIVMVLALLSACGGDGPDFEKCGGDPYGPMEEGYWTALADMGLDLRDGERCERACQYVAPVFEQDLPLCEVASLPDGSLVDSAECKPLEFEGVTGCCFITEDDAGDLGVVFVECK